MQDIKLLNVTHGDIMSAIYKLGYDTFNKVTNHNPKELMGKLGNNKISFITMEGLYKYKLKDGTVGHYWVIKEDVSWDGRSHYQIKIHKLTEYLKWEDNQDITTEVYDFSNTKEEDQWSSILKGLKEIIGEQNIKDDNPIVKLEPIPLLELNKGCIDLVEKERNGDYVRTIYNPIKVLSNINPKLDTFKTGLDDLELEVLRNNFTTEHFLALHFIVYKGMGIKKIKVFGGGVIYEYGAFDYTNNPIKWHIEIKHYYNSRYLVINLINYKDNKINYIPEIVLRDTYGLATTMLGGYERYLDNDSTTNAYSQAKGSFGLRDKLENKADYIFNGLLDYATIRYGCLDKVQISDITFDPEVILDIKGKDMDIIEEVSKKGLYDFTDTSALLFEQYRNIANRYTVNVFDRHEKHFTFDLLFHDFEQNGKELYLSCSIVIEKSDYEDEVVSFNIGKMKLLIDIETDLPLLGDDFRRKYRLIGPMVLKTILTQLVDYYYSIKFLA